MVLRKASVFPSPLHAMPLTLLATSDTRLAPLPAMAMAAAHTTTLRVGALVFDNDYKHPAILAKEAATIDLLCDGRLELGIGAGWMKTDYDALGLQYDPPAVRVDRFEEALHVIKQCFTGEKFTYHGEHYRMTDYTSHPKPAQAKVPLLNAGSSSIKITDPGNPWTFRIMPNEVMQGVDIATHAYKRLNARTAVLLYENTNAGIGNAKVFGDTFKALGGQILADIGFGRDVNDFTSIATRITGLGKVDVIPTYTLEGQGLRITQALAQAGVTKGGGGQSIQLGTIWLPFGFEQKAGKASLGYVRIVQFDPTDKREVVQDFIRTFKAKYNQDPTHINAHAFDQILLIADVVRRGATDAQSVRDIMAGTKNFSGVTGSVEFDKTNQNIKMDTIHYMETLPDLSWKALGWN